MDRSPSVTVVWVETDSGRIFHFAEDRMERSALRDTAFDALAERLASRLVAPQKILILSTTEAGESLAALWRQSRPDLAGRIVGVARTPRIDDDEIAAFALRYFRKPLGRTAG